MRPLEKGDKMPSQRFLELLEEIKDLHERKNAGYAGKDAIDPWANFRLAEQMGISALQGCVVRMSDKFIRIMNLMKDLSNNQVNESLSDTLMDLSVYSLIAICLLEEKNEIDLMPSICESTNSISISEKIQQISEDIRREFGIPK